MLTQINGTGKNITQKEDEMPFQTITKPPSLCLFQLRTHKAFNCYTSTIYNDYAKQRETITFYFIPDKINKACKFGSKFEIGYLYVVESSKYTRCKNLLFENEIRVVNIMYTSER